MMVASLYFISDSYSPILIAYFSSHIGEETNFHVLTRLIGMMRGDSFKVSILNTFMSVLHLFDLPHIRRDQHFDTSDMTGDNCSKIYVCHATASTSALATWQWGN